MHTARELPTKAAESGYKQTERGSSEWPLETLSGWLPRQLRLSVSKLCELGQINPKSDVHSEQAGLNCVILNFQVKTFSDG